MYPLKPQPQPGKTGSHVPYKSLVVLRAADTPDAARAAFRMPRTRPGRRVSPRFRHRLIRFRRFISGLHALASLNHICRDLVPTFPQRSPPLVATAACSGLKPAPDCRLRGTYPHLSYITAQPYSGNAFVAHGPSRKSPLPSVNVGRNRGNREDARPARRPRPRLPSVSRTVPLPVGR